MLSKKGVLLFAFLFSGIFLKAQVVADFIVQNDSGCVPFVASFTDQSSGHITYRHWDFGNGNTASGNKVSPSAVYTSSGAFDVTLTVSDGLDTSTITKTSFIHSLPLPSAGYLNQSQKIGCAEFDFFVTDNSVPGSVPITNWQWDFDDGSAGLSGSSVTHTYKYPGTYSISLTVTDAMGCTNNFVKSNLVTVQPKPVASFYSNDSLSVCGPPLTVNITNNSTSNSTLTHAWNIGGVAYTSLNVNPTFTTTGGFDAELIVTNTIGCKDTMFIPNYVWIGNIIANMDIIDTACKDISTEMLNSSFGGTQFSWDFGDGSSDIGDTVYHIYNTAGLYNVTMVSSSGATCDDTVTQSIYVESVVADFVSSPHFACQVPLSVNFTDMSPANTVYWEWHFGNTIGQGLQAKPNISNLQHPVNVYNDGGQYADSLYIESSNGCKDSIFVPINEDIIITQAAFYPSEADGCAPLYVDFTNVTDSVNRMAYWVWDFGDGSPTDTTFSPSHTFNNPGEYDVELTVVSIMGCTTSFEVEIKVGSRQTSNFTVDTIMACGVTDTVGFTNLSSDTGLINSYSWFFGDGESKGDFEPLHVYLDTGYMDVTLLVKYNGCPDTLTIDSAVRIMGPIGNFSPAFNCDSQNVVSFSSTSKGGTSFLWNFGDSTLKDSTNRNPMHTYLPVDSAYNVTLTIHDSNSGCTQELLWETRVIYLDADLRAADTTICRGVSVNFTTGYSTNGLSTVKWSKDNLALNITGSSDQLFKFFVKGPHTIFAEVSDPHFCKDTVSVDVFVFEPVPDFSLAPNLGCAPLTVQFTDLSTDVAPINKWSWNFGNGRFSSLQNPSFVFNGNGTSSYNVSLRVTDIHGCINYLDSINTVTVIEPPSFFTSPDVESCDGEVVSFVDQPVGNYTYLWDFGDGFTSTVASPTHIYANGTYDVQLTVTDSNGCDSTYVMGQYVDVQSIPQADFGANVQITDCYPSQIIFSDSSGYPNVDFYKWNFGDSPNYVITTTPTTQNLYTQPGLFDISLIVTSTYGCVDTIVKTSYINIGGPTGEVSFNPSIGCKGEEVDFLLTNVNADADRFVWDFGDGVVDTTYSPEYQTNHFFSDTGLFNVIVLIGNQDGTCQIIDTQIVEIDEVISNFILSDTSGCTPFSFSGVNASLGEDIINWYVNGVKISTNNNENFDIVNPGTHEIALIVKNNRSECLDTLVQEVTVHGLPRLNLTDDATICRGDSLLLKAEGAKYYKWHPNLWLDNDSIDSPLSIPDSSIMYYTLGIDANGCENNDSILITVQQEPILEWITPDTFIYLGESIYLNAKSSQELDYQWEKSNTLGCLNCSNPLAIPGVSTLYTLVYGDEYGCFVLDTNVFIEVRDEFKVTIPNTFTPEGDGLNDVFYPILHGADEMEIMQIFDRWGTKVFESENINIGWDGKVNGTIPNHNSIFSYRIRVRKYTKDFKDFTGTVLLLTKEN